MSLVMFCLFSVSIMHSVPKPSIPLFMHWSIGWLWKTPNCVLSIIPIPTEQFTEILTFVLFFRISSCCNSNSCGHHSKNRYVFIIQFIFFIQFITVSSLYMMFFMATVEPDAEKTKPEEAKEKKSKKYVEIFSTSKCPFNHLKNNFLSPHCNIWEREDSQDRFIN